MDNLFELIVFFITAVIFIVSAITKQKKKPASQASGMDNLVESFFGITDEVPQQKQPSVEVSDFEHEKNSIPTRAEYKMNINEKDNTMSKSDLNDNVEEEEAEKIEFNLRDAIIYSEILNRKHF